MLFLHYSYVAHGSALTADRNFIRALTLLLPRLGAVVARNDPYHHAHSRFLQRCNMYPSFFLAPEILWLWSD